MKPFLIFSKNICKGRIHFSMIAVPADVAELERMHRQNKREKVVLRIQDAVDLAARQGAEIIGLGGYTSILTNDGTLVVDPAGTRVVTGNTLTAASGIKNLAAEINKRFDPRRPKVLAVVGAAGNIGSIIAEGMLNSGIRFDRVILLGRNRIRLEKVRDQLKAVISAWGETPLEISTDLGEIRKCNIIIAATNTNDPVLFAHHFNTDEEIIVSDLSIPGAISMDVKEMPNIIDLPFASFIRMPDDPGLVVSSHTPKGTVFCCAAEAILCGLEDNRLPLKGRITMEAIGEMTKLAEKHHFFDRHLAATTFKVKY